MGAPIGGIHRTASIGDPGESRDLMDKHVRMGVPPHLWPQIHHSAWVGQFTTVHSGTVRATYIGPRAFVMAHAHVGHDCWVGPDVELSTGTILGGHTIVEAGARLGLGVVTLPHVRIGAGAIVGAGALVTRDVAPYTIAAGSPARLIREIEERDRYKSPSVIAGPWGEPRCGADAAVSILEPPC